ncbi:hypothetical protein ACFVXE_11890 [Streptomyces sp. NPDC058231]|uniref:hypothetical protein n=1 Tax=Streptomyces sp. NPDC058231 TaxID=3346392 RepID=UPI0036F113D4
MLPAQPEPVQVLGIDEIRRGRARWIPDEVLAGLNNPDLLRTCARFADDSKNDEGEEETVLQATRTTLRLLAQGREVKDQLARV